MAFSRPAPRPRTLLLVFLLAALAGCTGTAPRPAEQPIAAPEPLTPRGPTALPFSFTWNAVPGSSPIYRVRVTDAAERVLFEQDVRDTRCAPSGELTEMMAGGATFSWTIAALSRDGVQVAARSAPVAFSLK